MEFPPQHSCPGGGVHCRDDAVNVAMHGPTRIAKDHDANPAVFKVSDAVPPAILAGPYPFGIAVTAVTAPVDPPLLEFAVEPCICAKADGLR